MSIGLQSSDASEEQAVRVTEEEVLAILAQGRVEEQGLLPYSSNHSFLVTVEADGVTLPAVYKPRQGESPLWDFEWGSLCLRETAAYVVSQGLGWNLVPPTVLRDGTRGLGSVQFFVECDEEDHYFTVQSDARFASSFRQLTLFDYIINNADRKSGHCLVGSDQRMWAIDHGVCFHIENKLRTVIWEFSSQRVAQELLDDMVDFSERLMDRDSTLSRELCELLDEHEAIALRRRLAHLLRTAAYPAPSPHRRNYPWPPI